MYSVGRRLSLLNERERRYTISFGAPPALDCPNGPQRVRSVTLQRTTIAAEVYDDRPSSIAWMFGAIGGAWPSDGAAALSSAGVGALAPSRSRSHPAERRIGSNAVYVPARFPPRVRLATYVRAAEFALTHVRLQQSVS
jgi:hypothetical protein